MKFPDNVTTWCDFRSSTYVHKIADKHLLRAQERHCRVVQEHSSNEVEECKKTSALIRFPLNKEITQLRSVKNSSSTNWQAALRMRSWLNLLYVIASIHSWSNFDRCTHALQGCLRLRKIDKTLARSIRYKRYIVSSLIYLL